MSAFLFDTDASRQTYNQIAPAGHAVLSGNAVSYSYAGDTATQVVYVFGRDFTYAGGVVTGGTPNLILGTDNGAPTFEVRVYGVADPSIQKLSSLSFADQVEYLAGGDDYVQAYQAAPRANALVGGTGNDTLEDGPGTTSIDGGPGYDTARLHFNFADATFRYEGGTLVASAPQHQDRIVNVERFQFDDRSFDSLIALEQAAGINVGLNQAYRFYDRVTDDHFYTLDPNEAASIRANIKTFTYEGTPWSTPDKGTNTADVFRFYDTATKTHFLTSNVAERDSIIKNLPTYQFEGVAFQTYTNTADVGTVALERFYNHQTNVHTYALPDEAAGIRAGSAGNAWIDEGASFVVHLPTGTGVLG